MAPGTPISICSSCGDVLDAATGMFEDAAPGPGDISICLRCGNIMAFADDLSLRALTDAEAHSIAGDPKILAVQRERVAVLKEKPDASR